MGTTDSFKINIANELAQCVFSIEEPLNLSDETKFLEQNQPLQNYFDEPAENLPLCVLYLDLEDAELVANDRYETAIATDFAIIYRIAPDESRKSGLEKGQKCMEQFIDKIKARQRNGTALVPFYLNGESIVEAATPNDIDYQKIDSAVAVATAKFVLNHLKQRSEYA